MFWNLKIRYALIASKICWITCFEKKKKNSLSTHINWNRVQSLPVIQWGTNFFEGKLFLPLLRTSVHLFCRSWTRWGLRSNISLRYNLLQHPWSHQASPWWDSGPRPCPSPPHFGLWRTFSNWDRNFVFLTTFADPLSLLDSELVPAEPLWSPSPARPCLVPTKFRGKLRQQLSKTMRKQQPTHLYLVLCSLDTLSSPCGLFRPPLRLLLLKENAGEMMLIARILPFFSKRWKLVALKSVFAPFVRLDDW